MICVPLPLAFAALNVSVVVPAVVGLPEIKPLDVLTLSPAGSPLPLRMLAL